MFAVLPAVYNSNKAGFSFRMVAAVAHTHSRGLAKYGLWPKIKFHAKIKRWKKKKKAEAKRKKRTGSNRKATVITQLSECWTTTYFFICNYATLNNAHTQTRVQVYKLLSFI